MIRHNATITQIVLQQAVFGNSRERERERERERGKRKKKKQLWMKEIKITPPITPPSTKKKKIMSANSFKRLTCLKASMKGARSGVCFFLLKKRNISSLLEEEEEEEEDGERRDVGSPGSDFILGVISVTDAHNEPHTRSHARARTHTHTHTAKAKGCML